MEKKKILIVDDEADVLNVLEKRLSDVGYAIVKANNGQDAVLLAKKEKPDLILLDIMMPYMDGGKVAEALHNNPATKSIPIIFLTCLLTKDEERKGGREISGQYFIAKPYEPNDLLDEIEKHIG